MRLPSPPARTMTSTFGSAMTGMYPQTSVNVLFVTPECYPLVKTGGLADVTGALPLALRRRRCRRGCCCPATRAFANSSPAAATLAQIADLFGGDATLVAGTTDGGLKVLLIEAPHLFAREGGGPYRGPDGHDWPDNHLRFAALSWVAARRSRSAGWAPGSPTSCTCTTGRRRSLRRTCTSTIRPRRPQPTVLPAHAADDPQPRVPGLFPQSAVGTSCACRRSSARRRTAWSTGATSAS